jgi:anti-sigma B factor antagonist
MGLIDTMATPAVPAAMITFASALGESPVVMKLSGDLDLCSENQVENAMLYVWWHPPDIVIDLSELAFCGCGGVSIFIRIAGRYAANGGRLSLAAPRRSVRRLFDLVRLDEAVPVYQSVVAAIVRDQAERISRFMPVRQLTSSVNSAVDDPSPESMWPSVSEVRAVN